jgi:hypothetical protein
VIFATIPVLFAVAGAVFFLLTKDPERKKLWLIVFACGFLVAVFAAMTAGAVRIP